MSDKYMRRTIRFNDTEEAVIKANSGEMGASEFVRQCVRQHDLSDKKVSDNANLSDKVEKVSDKVPEMVIHSYEEIKSTFKGEKFLDLGEEKSRRDFNSDEDYVNFLVDRGNITDMFNCPSCHKKSRFVKDGEDWRCTVCYESGSEMSTWM